MRTRIVLAVAASVLALSACGSTTSSASAPELPGKPTSTVAKAVTDNPDTNERGNIVKKLGEEASFGPAPDRNSVSFVIDKIDVDPPCWQHGQKPASGHTLVLHVRIATGDDADAARMTGSIINSFNFAEIGSDGVTHRSQIGTCTDFKQQLQPGTYGTNQKYTGTIEIVVPEASGVLALAPAAMQGGWEWHY